MSADYSSKVASPTSVFGTPLLAIKETAATDLSGATDGNFAPLQVDANGNLRCIVAPAAVGSAEPVKITDGTNTLLLYQFHNSDNQSLGAGYQLPAGGISQVLNVNGNLDRARGIGGDQMIGSGIPLDVSMTAQIFPPTFCTATLTAGANRVLTVPSTANIKVGSIVQVELGANALVEWCRVNAVSTNVSITVDTLANAHTQPYAVFPVLFNMPRDAGAEQDLAGGSGATLAIDYNFDGTTYQRARNPFGLATYSDTSASNVAAGNNVTITTVGTPPTLAAGQTIPVLIIDSANTQQELAVCIATNPGGKTMTFQTLVAAYNGSVTPLQIRSPKQSLLTAPQNFNGWGLAGDLAVVFSGLDANSVAQFSVEKDVNAAGLNVTQGTAGATGMDADINYGVYRTAANVPALADKGMTPFQIDQAGTLKTGVITLGTPVAATATSGAAGAVTCALAAVAAKLNYITGFEVTGMGATAGSGVACTLAGLVGGTLNYTFGVPAGVTVPCTPLVVPFNPPMPATAVNSAITLTVPTFGAGNVAASASIRGFQI